MASAQAKGILRFYKVDSGDNTSLIHTVNMQSIGAGGSPDGAIANSPEKWQIFPLFGSQGLAVNDRLRVTYEASANTTLDASDAAFILPITLTNNTISFLGHPTSSSEWDIRQLGDTAYVANIETPAFEMRVKRAFYLGSNKEKAFISLEDNTA